MQNSKSIPILRQIWNFLIHLRLHYQFLVLSGPYLLSALYVQSLNWEIFLIQFLNVHVLLFGGATAYNSFWDKDEGPVGGLKRPPAMKEWMHRASIVIQLLGFVLAVQTGLIFTTLYVFSFLLFWLYSTPHARWKGRPLLSLAVIGLSTGTNSFLMGYLAAGGILNALLPFLAATGAAFVLLSLYPVSQLFQIEADLKRGDQTFASQFGLKGIIRFYIATFLSGVLLISGTLYHYSKIPSIVFGGVSLFAFVVILRILKNLSGKEEEYELVMKMKFTASLSIAVFIIFSILIKHNIIGIEILRLMFEHQN